MTKKQAIKQLEAKGYKFIRNDGRFSVVLNPPVCDNYPANWLSWSRKVREITVDPRDFLAALNEPESTQPEGR
jgi:hypothetical protein